MQNVMQALYLTRNARGLPASARRYTSGAEKAYKVALRKLKKDLYGGAYGRWLSAQKAIRAAKAEAEADLGHYTTPQITWLDEEKLAERFFCEVAALIRVHEIFSDALETETE